MNNNEVVSFERIRDAFYVYCDIIERYGKGKEGSPIGSFYIGCVILGSLACEIGLKALLALEDKPLHGHCLNNLFNNLNPQMQESIIQYTSYELESFNNALLENKDHFVKWRYYYESNQLAANYDFIFKLFYSIKTHLDTINPEYQTPDH
ncbi:hypothetical protein QR305_02051 [Bacteroides finegoldii]|jgi:hypothetical protein|uniref:HEPN domain-containing protein n=1 Tax=Bacteroides finegoldii CL09T03C10 TaxID=997888 RepID=K5DFT7_9BACE|nr:hypothetical protein [Bacteroides finegoldii]EKJ91793.1 hypothetical protein HMPREF1057_00628 [Bacteroides finegoldii CL09T03C10]